MSTSIRQYNSTDYKEIASWLDFPINEQTLNNSTFILEIDNVPAYCLTVYFTNSKELALIENFAGNPKLKEERKPYSQVLWVYLEDLAKELGYKQIICLAKEKKLSEKYESFGYSRIMNNVDVMGKVL